MFSRDSGVEQTECVVEDVGPELYSKVGTVELRMDHVVYCLVAPFDRAVLVMGICASRINGEAKVLKEGTHFWIGEESAVLVHHDVLVFNLGVGIHPEKMSEPVHWGCFGKSWSTKLLVSVMIRHKNIA